MEQINNPAGRLHALLTQFRDHAEGGGSTMQAWASVFGVEANDYRLMGMKLAKAAHLITQLDWALERLEVEGDNTAPYHRKMGAWARPVFFWDKTGTQSGGSNAPGDLVQQDVLDTLAIASHALSARLPRRRNPSGEELTKLADDIGRLLRDAIESGKIPEELRRFLVDHLVTLRDAVEDFRITGPEEVQRIVDEAWGDLFRRMGEVADDPDSRSWLTWLRDVLEEAEVIVGLASGLHQLGSTALKAITGG